MLTQSSGQVTHSASYAPGCIAVHRVDEFAPRAYSASCNDIVDGSLGKLASGKLRKMPMHHQWLFQFNGANFEHQIDGGTQSTYAFQSEFGKLASL